MDANVYFLQLSGFDLAEVSAEPQYSTSFREHQPATTNQPPLGCKLIALNSLHPGMGNNSSRWNQHILWLCICLSCPPKFSKYTTLELIEFLNH